VIEGKFDASFQPAQLDPQGYLKRVTPGMPGVYAVLAPARSLETYLDELHLAHGLSGSGAPAHRFRPVGDGRFVGGISWEELLHDIVRRTGQSAEYARQLLDLASEFSDPDWVPLRSESVTQSAGQDLAFIKRAMYAAIGRLGREGMKVSTGSWSDGFGKYVSSTSDPREKVYIGIFVDAWALHGHSPVWVQILEDTMPPQQALTLLQEVADPAAPPHLGSGYKGAVLPIALPVDTDEDSVVNAIHDRAVVVLDGIRRALLVRDNS
jgi:hypothetical protein